MLAWTLVVAAAAFVFFASGKTGADFAAGKGLLAIVSHWLKANLGALLGPSFDPFVIGHFVEYFICGALLVNALRFHVDMRRALVGAVVIASAYGITDEFHQIFVPGRTCDPVDWVVDTVAALLGALLARQIVRVTVRRRGHAGGDS